MSANQKAINWLEEVIAEGRAAAAWEIVVEEGWDEYQGTFTYESKVINTQKSTKFTIRSLSCLENVFGDSSAYYLAFKDNADKTQYDFQILNLVAILESSLEDLRNGYLTNTKFLIEAEVFDDFLEQAEQLFAKGYHAPAAVVAGCVLEDGLKKLCAKNGITLAPKATMNPANDELAKAGVYNTLMQKKVLAMADLRNKAAHGQWAEFTKEDVGEMIKSVRSFLETHYV